MRNIQNSQNIIKKNINNTQNNQLKINRIYNIKSDDEININKTLKNNSFTIKIPNFENESISNDDDDEDECKIKSNFFLVYNSEKNLLGEKRKRKKIIEHDFINYENSEIEEDNSDNNTDKDEEGNNIFICDVENCNKEFYDLTSLKKHKINHGEKQFPCPYDGCSRKFLDNSKLRRHLLVHTVIYKF